jgi:hypothetical protein
VKTVVAKYLLVAGVSAAAGYGIAVKRLERRFYEDLARETDEAKDFYRRKYMKKAAEEGEDPELTQAAIDASEALKLYSGIKVGPSILTQEMEAAVSRAPEFSEEVPSSEAPEEDPGDVLIDEAEHQENMGALIDRANGGPVDYAKISTPVKTEEIPKQRDDSEPVEITEQEFIANDNGYPQFSLTYYVGDGVLSNASDEILTDEARLKSLGARILEDLKVGGLDPIYVRNAVERWEFDIARSPGKYSVEVGNETG